MQKSIKEATRVSVEITHKCVSLAEVFFGWVDDEFGQARDAAKKLAALASTEWNSVSHRTAEKWKQHKNPPQAESLEIMIARCDELAERVRQQREALRERLR